MVLKELTIDNGVLFKKARLRLDSGHVIVVRGENQRSGRGDSNGSGKSLLVDFIPNTIYGANPFSDKASTLPGLDPRKPCIVRLTLVDGKTEYVVEQRNDKGSTRYRIFKDGVDQGVRKVGVAKDYINRLWPVDESEYYSIWNLNSDVTSLLQKGTPTKRLEFFTDFFSLGFYDAMRKEFNTKLRSIEDSEVELSAYESQIMTSTSELEDLEKPDVPDDIEDQYKTLQASNQKLEAKRNKLGVMNSLLEKRDSFLESLRTEYEEHDLDRQHKRLLVIKKKLLANREAQVKRDNLKAIISRMKSGLAQQKKELLAGAETHDCTTLKELSLFLKDYVSEVDEFSERLADVSSRLRQFTKLKEDLDDAMQEVADREADYTGKIPKTIDTEAIEEQIANDRMSIRLFSSVAGKQTDDTCPVCDGELELGVLERKADAAKDRIHKNKLLLSIASAREELQELADDDIPDLEDLQKEKKRVGILLRAAREHDSEVDYLSSEMRGYKRDLKRYKTALAEMEHLPEVEEMEGNLHDIGANIADVSSDIQVFESIASLRERWTELHNTDLDDQDTAEVQEQHEAAIAEAKTCMEKLRTLSDDKSRMDVYRAKVQTIESKIASLQEKSSEIQGIISEKPIYKALIKAYSSKGIKLLQIRKISDILVSNLNRYRPLLFHEPFTFSCNIDDVKFELLVDRGDGKLSDVRRMSKSESRRFVLILMLSLLPLSQNRLSLVILDEMDSGFSDINKRMLREDFIPQLHSVIPNLVVVTPDYLDYPGSVDVKVVKDKNGVSSLVCQHPDLV